MRNIDLTSAYSGIYENQRAARNPDQSSDKKYDRVRGEKTPMPPRGDKRREDFEKWYAKQMKEDHAEAWDEFIQLDEVAPLIAGLAGKAATALASKAATGAAAKVGGGLAKAASSKLGQKAISAGSNAVGNKVTSSMTSKNEEYESLDEAEKDACYNKVKSRYDVWPSAYASGALVKCRAKGASNWGNSSKKSSKKEEFEYETEENYTAQYMEGYKSLPADKMKNQQKGKSKDGDGPAQARKMEVVRKATQGSEGMVKDAVKGQEMSNKKRGLEKRFNAPSANKSNKNKAYELEGQRRRDLDNRYGPKKEELEAVFATLIGEGIAHNEESAINIMTHMSDEWYDSLVEDILDEAMQGDKRSLSQRKAERRAEEDYAKTGESKSQSPSMKAAADRVNAPDAPAQGTKKVKPAKGPKKSSWVRKGAEINPGFAKGGEDARGNVKG